MSKKIFHFQSSPAVLNLLTSGSGNTWGRMQWQHMGPYAIQSLRGYLPRDIIGSGNKFQIYQITEVCKCTMQLDFSKYWSWTNIKASLDRIQFYFYTL